MKPDRTRVFLRFFFGFVAIIALAFGVLLFAGYQTEQQPAPIDNVAGQQ
jgi:hypothetical protein